MSINFPYGLAWNTVVLFSYLLLGIVRSTVIWICRTVWPSLAASLEPLAHCQNVASFSLFYRYYFGRCSSELVQLFHFFTLVGGLLVILIEEIGWFFYVNSFFPRTVTLWNSLCIECFPLTYNLNGFKSTTNRHLLTVAAF